MKNILYFSCLTLAIMGTACNFNPKPLDIEIDDPEPRLVISSIAIPPQELALTVTRTFSALLPAGDSLALDQPDVADQILVDSALVTVAYAGRIDTLIKLAPGLYGSITLEQLEGTAYTLFVHDYDTGLEVTAVTEIMPRPSFDSLYTVTKILTFQGQSDTTVTIHYQFPDFPGVSNYYLATYTNLAQLGDLANLNSVNSLFSFNQTQFHVFADQATGDGQPIRFTPDFVGNPGDTLAVALSNIPKGYYEFLSAYKRSGNLLAQLTAEPINLPTNVIGGYGYFSLLKPKVELVILR